jgi:hypothetical protein
MEELNNALTRYFKRLSQVGFIPDETVYSILVLYYITHLKESLLLTIEDNLIIKQALLSLQGSCLMPYKSCKESCNQ